MVRLNHRPDFSHNHIDSYLVHIQYTQTERERKRGFIDEQAESNTPEEFQEDVGV